MKDTGGRSHVIHFDLDVKSWANAMPGVREARPGRCPGCQTPSVEPGGKVVVQGHGLRGRQRWGPPEHDAAAEVGVMMQRRYRCTRCGAVIVVRPRGVVAHRRYTLAAIALSLWLWAVELWNDAQVRTKASVRPTAGISRPERWTTLRRWARAAREGRLWRSVAADTSWTLREHAERVVRVLAAAADPELGGEQRRVFAAGGTSPLTAIGT